MKKSIETVLNNLIASAEEKVYLNENYEHGYLEGLEDMRHVFNQEFKTIDQMQIALLRKRDTLNRHMLNNAIAQEDEWIDSEDHHKTLGFYDALGDGIDGIQNICE